MKAVNVAELRAHFSEYLAEVEKGEDLQICKRNRAVARMSGVDVGPGRNATRLGSAKGSVKVLGSIVDPIFDADEWEMHR